MKRIPKSFTVGGLTFAVKLVDLKTMRGYTGGVDAYGLFVRDELTIYLLKPSKELRKPVVIQTFWHEYFHAALWVASGPFKNEKLVDQLGHLQAQFFETATF